MADHLNSDSVGKGRPPAASRFRHGKSGNPLGRKKGRVNLKTIVMRVAHELHPVIEGGEPQTHTTVELIFIRLQERAVGGDLEAKKILDELRERYRSEELTPVLSGIICPPRLELDDFMKIAKGAREKMLWDQEQRLKEDAADERSAAAYKVT